MYRYLLPTYFTVPDRSLFIIPVHSQCLPGGAKIIVTPLTFSKSICYNTARFQLVRSPTWTSTNLHSGGDEERVGRLVVSRLQPYRRRVDVDRHVDSAAVERPRHPVRVVRTTHVARLQRHLQRARENTRAATTQKPAASFVSRKKGVKTLNMHYSFRDDSISSAFQSTILPRDAMLARFMLSSCVPLSVVPLSVCLSVCLSVRPSQAGTVSKPLDESSWLLAWRLTSTCRKFRHGTAKLVDSRAC